MFNRLYKHLPLVTFITSATALTFQTNVLYPWHKDISNQIKLLEQKIDKHNP